MAQYEYRVEHKPAGGRVAQINDRLASLAAEDWEPILMTGDGELYILLKRPARGSGPAPAGGPEE